MADAGSRPLTVDAVSSIQSHPDADRTTLRQRVTEVDGLRGLAALLVLLAHAHVLSSITIRDDAWLTYLRDFLGHGVFLFFVLSGYLIGGPFVVALADRGRLSDFREYGVRRLARIFPAYWVAFTALLIFVRPDFQPYPWQLPVHYLLLQNWLPNEAQGIYPIAWTLGIEVLFYAVVPLLAAWGLARRPSVDQIAAALVLGGVAITALAVVADLGFGPRGSGRYQEWAFYLRNSPLPWLALFAPGVLVALGHTEAARRRGGPWNLYYALVRRPWWVFALVVVLIDFAAAFQLSSAVWMEDTGNRTLIALASALLLGAVVESGGWWSSPVRLLAPLGLISYGIYLWQWVTLTWIAQQGWYTSVPQGGMNGFFAATVILAAATIPLAALSWFAVERPIIKWSAGWAHRQASVRAQLKAGATQQRRADDNPEAQ